MKNLFELKCGVHLAVVDMYITENPTLYTIICVYILSGATRKINQNKRAFISSLTLSFESRGEGK